MLFEAVFGGFVKASPVRVLNRMLFERMFAASRLDDRFQNVAERQYTHELRCSTVVDIMSLVVIRSRSSVHAVYRDQKGAVGVRDPGTDAELVARRMTVTLDTPTRDGETEIPLTTNLSAKAADALKVAALHRHRWQLETAFQATTVDLKCEIDTLGYPQAALFGFCVVAAEEITASATTAWVTSLGLIPTMRAGHRHGSRSTGKACWEQLF